MFKVRLQEVSLPTSDRDIDSLTTWFIDTLCLVRKRGDEMADHGFANPVHRLLRDYLFAQPEVGWDAQMLADELALTCLLYTSPSPRDMRRTRMPSSA